MTIKTQLINYPINAHSTPGYLAQPDNDATSLHPGVVVIQEWWGLVPHSKDVAGRLAREERGCETITALPAATLAG